jgi:hypothetical protein
MHLWLHPSDISLFYGRDQISGLNSLSEVSLNFNIFENNDVYGGFTMSASNISHVTLASTEDRKSGVESSIRALEINPAKNKDVLIKPNFNTADQCPGSTHNDTLVALVEEVWKMGAKSVSLGERSYSENCGQFPLERWLSGGPTRSGKRMSDFHLLP